MADQYPNLLTKRVTQSGANTLTYDEITVGLNLFDKVGLLIEAVEYTPVDATLAMMTTSSDVIVGGLTSSSTLTDLNPNQEEIIDAIRILRLDYGTAAAAQIMRTTHRRSFADLGGGGLLIPPKPLYLAMDSSGLASAGSLDLRIYFRVIPLKDTEYLELLESRRAFG